MGAYIGDLWFCCSWILKLPIPDPDNDRNLQTYDDFTKRRFLLHEKVYLILELVLRK
jgi:hypothetical protein